MQVFGEKDDIDNINDQYWHLRAEAVPEDQLSVSEQDQLMHVYHFSCDQQSHVGHCSSLCLSSGGNSTVRQVADSCIPAGAGNHKHPCSSVTGLSVHLCLLQVHNFGDPFLLRITDTDTLADIRPQIQQKLGIADEEFAKWKFAVIANLRPPDYLSDEDNIASKFVKSTNSYSSGQDGMYLGLEHTDAHPHRHRHHNNR